MPALMLQSYVYELLRAVLIHWVCLKRRALSMTTSLS